MRDMLCEALLRAYTLRRLHIRCLARVAAAMPRFICFCRRPPPREEGGRRGRLRVRSRRGVRAIDMLLYKMRGARRCCRVRQVRRAEQYCQ